MYLKKEKFRGQLKKHHLRSGIFSGRVFKNDLWFHRFEIFFGIKLNMDSQKEIWTESLVAALHDCLYRNMKSFKYLMLIGRDKLIIPYQIMTLVEMLNDLGTSNLIQAGKPISPSQVSSYGFQNALFDLQCLDNLTFLTNPRLTALLKTRRRQKLHPPKQRSKYICLPSAIKPEHG